MTDLAQFDGQQLAGITCARCGRHLGAWARRHGGPVRDERGQEYQLWRCLEPCVRR
ncbi:hypothetical protein ACWD33_25960 [Streptomyces xiamenensis]